MQRWSRLKTQGQEAAAPVAMPNQQALPALDSLTPDSDFSAFLQPDVDTAARQSALKKLFISDHYRSMDMLDVYVDDYSKPELLPTDMLSRLEHAANLLNTEKAPDQDQQQALQIEGAALKPEQLQPVQSADEASSSVSGDDVPQLDRNVHNDT